jgi:hypothetical protein
MHPQTSPLFGKIPVPCEWCGAHFLVWPSEGNRRFCSVAHWRAWQRDPARLVALTCAGCGVTRRVKPYDVNHRFCSRACYRASALEPAEARFWRGAFVRGPDECWPWLWERDRHGYGRIFVKLGPRWSTVLAHRYAFFLTHRRWPRVARHTCDHPWCVNPAHLRDGTQRENLQDMWARGRGRPRAKLTPAQVEAIRADRRPQRQIAAEYGVQQPAISRIKAGVRWPTR